MDSFKFNLTGAGTDSPFGGYVSEADRTTLSRRFLVKGSKNVYLKGTGTIAVRPGLKRRGSGDTTNAGVLSSFEWDTSLGLRRNLRVANGKLEVEHEVSGSYVWAQLLSGLTNTRLIFDTWWDNTAKKDILLWCDGTDDLKYWSGGVTTITATTASTIQAPASVVTLGFGSSGTLIINGTEYTYSGVSTDTFTGVSPNPTGEAANSVVVQKPVTDTDTVEANFEIDFIKVINNQLYCGSESSRLVYISRNNDFDDFTKSSPRTVGEGDTLTLDETPLGIGMRNGIPCIGTKKAWYEVSFSRITVGTTLTEQTKVDRRPMAINKCVLRHEFIENVGNDLLYLSQDQQLTLYGVVPNIDQPQFPSLSEDIKTELENEDFTNGHLRAMGDFIYITAPNNGRLWLHETMTKVGDSGNIQQKKIWHPPFIVSASRIAEIEGQVYLYSNSFPVMFQLWDTLQWEDDSNTDENIPYDCVAVFPYFSARRFDFVKFDKVYVEGYMTQGSTVYGSIAYEYQGDRTVQSLILNQNSTAIFYTGDVGVALGDASIGDNPLGDQTSEEEADQELLPKFRTIADVQLQNVHEYQMRVYSTDKNSRWELLCLGTNEEVSEDKPTYLRN